ncbi:MAG: cation transporter [Acutalibacteraceae bacterium]|nr:cation transporter [Acutalibacteraceae bacterium]
MKKTFLLEDLDCAHCAAKIEEEVRKIGGVNFANVNFIAQKMTVEAEDAEFDKITKEIKAVVKKIEPDCVVVD